MERDNRKIGLLLVSTGKYHIFLQPLIDGVEKHFFPDHKVEIYLFSDRINELKHSDMISVHQIPTEHKPFPYPTLYRYRYFNGANEVINCDYLFYLDVDMAIVGDVGEEILPDGKDDEGLVATLHPGFFKGGGSWGDNQYSTSYTHPLSRKKYYAGGFQGGTKTAYLQACKLLSENIAEDESKGIIAIHNDETHWNAYLAVRRPKELTPEYCQVEELDKRRRWGTADFAPRIIALAKDHNALRQ